MKFCVGHSVTWRSQSQGSWATKVGVIAEIVPPLARPDAVKWPQLFKGAGIGAARAEESYVVTVGKKVYWPRANKLQPAVTSAAQSEEKP